MDLYGMTFSPYSEKARWALDHHRVAYRWREHVPLAGELALRWRAGSLRRKASVPLAVDGETVLRESYAIAQHAERVGSGEPLFEDATACKLWDDRGAAALNAGRALVIGRNLVDRGALADSLPPWIPAFVRPAAAPIAANANRYLLRKYGGAPEDAPAAVEEMRRALAMLRAALGGRATILPAFSYADVAMAVVLQMVSPVAERYIALGDARRRAWEQPELAREFADLVEWRDELYAERRGGRRAGEA
jgi:glutathione S-transferase